MDSNNFEQNIKGIRKKWKGFCDKSLRVGFFLALKQLKRTSLWTTGLIIIIMLFTFLNLIVINGIFMGIVEGSSQDYKEHYSGDIFISKTESRSFIKDGEDVVNSVKRLDGVENLSVRYLAAGSILANYTKQVRPPEKPDSVGVQLTGIDPEDEDGVTNLSELIVEGEYLREGDRNYLLLGSNLLEQYSAGIPGIDTLEGIGVGSKVKVNINGGSQEFRIKGIIESKVGELSRRAYVIDSYLRQIVDRKNNDADEIAVKITKSNEAEEVKSKILQSRFDEENVLVQTSEESQGEFIKDISNTMNILSSIIGLIGLAVSSITVFIIVFINAISRERYIGILKGIGICGSAIQISYIFQSLFYAFFGTILGLVLLFGLIKPYLDANPIDFPFSDGILVVPFDMVAVRIILLFVVTMIAGYIPASLVIKRNTLDSILGKRNEI